MQGNLDMGGNEILKVQKITAPDGLLIFWHTGILGEENILVASVLVANTICLNHDCRTSWPSASSVSCQVSLTDCYWKAIAQIREGQAVCSSNEVITGVKTFNSGLTKIKCCKLSITCS